MKGIRAVVVAGLVSICVVLPGLFLPALGDDSPCLSCVESNTGTQAYRGALLIPADSKADPPELTQQAAHCPGCAWKLEPDCRDTAGTGDVMCPGAIGTCPPGKIRLVLLLQRDGTVGFVPVGTFCRGPGEPLTPVELIPGVRDHFLQYLPALRPSFQPSGRGIVNLPVLFATGQPRRLGRHDFALGPFGIVLDATTTWHWDFGDGTAADFTTPGGSYPDTSVAHTYAQAGAYRAAVTATWAGEFWVDGAGPFEVTGPAITQEVTLTVPVKEARAILVGPMPGLTGWSARPGPG